MTILYELFTDGATKNNQKVKKVAGSSSIGAILKTNSTMVGTISEIVQEGTNNETEYRSLIRGLNLLDIIQLEPGTFELKIYMDSLLVVNQVNGVYKINKENFREFVSDIRDKLKNHKWSLSHVKREYNTEADALANEAYYRFKNGKCPKK